MWAYLHGYYDLVETLAARGASVDQRLSKDLIVENTAVYYKGDSILFMFARNTPQRDRLIQLLKYSQDLNQRDTFGHTVFHYYVGLSMLKPPQGTVDVYKSDIARFVASGIDIDATARSGETPLHLALKYDPLQCIALLENGASRDLPDADGKSFVQKVNEEVAKVTSTNDRLKALEALLQYMQNDSN